ncbi:ABC transporter permease [Photobacterium sanctipauli]|uniref:ABC transporter permease n=1 Tax=Photobacterium sanctipauli TaxID=1342794 RepID=A0A2T3NX53_9GAMM|nr:ABC transporter permease [Photobacterium sanctipauli]PSW20883.1 ABC transporter permease [Photobacterium sanctipauli]
MTNSLRSLLGREWQIIRRDRWILALVTWVPLLIFMLLWGIFSSGIARDLPIGVVDLDHSRLSRQLIRQYDASPVLSVDQAYASVEQGSYALRGGDIYALVVIPPKLEKQTLTGMSPTVTTFYNSQFILIAKLVNAAVMQAQGTLNASIDTLKNMADGTSVPIQAIGQAVPLRSQITPLYNSNSHYGQFIVSAAIPAVWQIAIVVTTILALSFETRANGNTGLSLWLSRSPLRHFIMKLLPYTLLFMVQGALFLWALYGLLGWPMHGSWGVLLLAQALMVFACQAIACVFYLFTLDATKAMSLAAGFTAPAFAFVGVTFPASDMPLLAQIWRAMLPVTHYLDVQVHQVNHGFSWGMATPQLLSLLSFSAVFVLVGWRLKNLALDADPTSKQASKVQEITQ